MGRSSLARTIDPRLMDEQLCAARRIAQQTLKMPGSDAVRAVKYGQEAACALLQIQVATGLAAQFRHQTLHRSTEGGGRSSEIRRDRLMVASELLPGLCSLNIRGDWLAISLVTQFDGAMGHTIDRPVSAAT